MVLKIELKLEEVNVVLAGLGELPAKLSMDIIDKIRSQVIPQVNEKPAISTTETQG